VAAQPDLTNLDLESLAADVVALAVNVRLGQVETLKESGSLAGSRLCR
jgi:hypothetical protein